MNYKKFDSSDILKNVIKTYPENNITFFSGSVYIKSLNQIPSGDPKNSYLVAGSPVNYLQASGDNTTTYIINAVNPSTNAYVPKNLSDAERYNRITNSEYSLNSKITSSINCILTSSITNPYMRSLKNTLDWYSSVSPYYNIENFEDKDLAIINIPSVFYGSTIKRGSVSLDYYFSGTLVSKLEDFGSDGSLRETTGSNIDKVAGVVLYDEGIILLSGSWDLPEPDTTKWNIFGSASNKTVYSSSSFNLNFKGTNYIPTLTMFAHAEKNDYNTTNNKTWIDHTQDNFNYVITSSNTYKENDKILIKNTVKTNYETVSGSFKKQTFINKIGIYDENHKLIAVAKLATPVKKNNEREYTFKLKLDM